MAKDRHIYGEINTKTDLKKIFSQIRHDVDEAGTRPALTELYKRAGYLITLSHAPSWEKKLGHEAAEIRQTAGYEFSSTARQINQRAEKIGTEADYDEQWGDRQ
jgi:hypothetical protein